MIKLENVVKKFARITAVENISLDVKPGEIFGLVGPDGAGKTTAIRLITGLYTPTSGSVIVLGSQSIEKIKSNLGYVPQKFSLYGDLTVIENIRIIGALYGASNGQIEEKANEILEFTKLIPFKNRLADNLSGGMKQKLALAAGLMHKPRLFLLDEPTTGVDPVSRREFWQMLYRLNKEGMTIFVSTPYMDEAELCHRIAFMHNGKIVACDSPQKLKERYPYKILELHVDTKDIKPYLEGIALLDLNAFGEKYHLVVNDPVEVSAEVLEKLLSVGIKGYTLQEIPPTLEDVFVALANEVMT